MALGVETDRILHRLWTQAVMVSPVSNRAGLGATGLARRRPLGETATHLINASIPEA